MKLLFLIAIFSIIPSKARAFDSALFHSVNVGDHVIGEYIYVGYWDKELLDGGAKGMSYRYGFGTQGQKITVSFSEFQYFGGYDIGLSYIKPNEESTHVFSGKDSVIAIEGTFKLFLSNVTIGITEENIYASLGWSFNYGF
ncbi:hypothetical protein [Psychrosphaera algicola]|uniref:Uncharacterized protein n=1 Tax=Psychrosphaera algicola TaxID=3023714 RepID=A0ABT5FCI8_9GAMM|nr:hypothetical protein [Psychrosphaera sp. G1-22]MDC2889121.1 hypothetical protein [Psychrosphaera sp. G1-22]